jgi:hypothetical protein
MDAQDRALTVLSHADLLRGVPSSVLLQGMGSIFSSSEGTVSKKSTSDRFRHKHFLRSLKTTKPLKGFISHSWQASRVKKFIALAMRIHGGKIAFSATLILLIATFSLVASGFGDSYAVIALFFATPFVFMFVLLGIVSCPSRTDLYFLDRCCINQQDSSQKQAGIERFAEFVLSCNTLIVLWDHTYLTRLWCVFELATAAAHLKYSGRDVSESIAIIPLWIPALSQMLSQGAFVVLGVLMSCFLGGDPLLLGVLGTIGCLWLVVTLFWVKLRFRRDLNNMIRQLSNFRFDETQCSLESDRISVRSYINAVCRDWSDGSSGVEAFEAFVRTELKDLMETHVFTMRGVLPYLFGQSVLFIVWWTIVVVSMICSLSSLSF